MEIAKLHVDVWRQTYRDIAPPAAYAALDEQRRYDMWSGKLSDSDYHLHILVAENEGEIVGMGAAGRPSESIFGPRAEIKHLYIQQGFKRRGIGRRILSDIASLMKDSGYNAAALSVVKGNEPAELFYRAQKGRVIGEFIDPGPIWRSQNIVYAWDDINDLIS